MPRGTTWRCCWPEQKQRLPEALGLWRENLTRAPDYLPSRLSLAEALPDPKEAIAEYRVVLKDRPEYLAARLALADLMQKTGDSGSALAELQEGLKTQKSSAIYERIGDIEAGQNHASEARAAYQSALESAPDANAVKRLRKKIK